MADCIASNWRALSGIEDNWETLRQDPIPNKTFRKYLIHYGERVEAVVDSFNKETKSQTYALPLFPPEVFFSETCLEKGNPVFKYKVTDFIYARSVKLFEQDDDPASAYIGYVAVATDEGKQFLGRRDILICWRGTITHPEGLLDLFAVQISAQDLFPNAPAAAQVHAGFSIIYSNKTPDSTTDSNSAYTQNSAREQVLAAVRKQVDYFSEEEVSITVAGHSLGGALATLNSMDIVYNGYNKPTNSNTQFPVTAFVSGCPRVGNYDFCDWFNSLPNLHLLRITSAGDPITEVPYDLPPYFPYSHVGVSLDIKIIDAVDISYDTNNRLTLHDPMLYLYAIAYYQGEGIPSAPAIPFDLSILNKTNNYVDTVPNNWWPKVFRNGMVQKDDGFWIYNYVAPLPHRVPNV